MPSALPLGPRARAARWPGAEKVWIWWSVLLAASLVGTHHARADTGDYALDNQGWNGLSELLSIARGAGLELRVPHRIDLAALRPGDGLLLVYPAEPPPARDLSAFMAEGGRLAVADDFGAGGRLLASFGVGRSKPGSVPPERRLRGNVHVLIAKPRARHPLNAQVLALVTNHPQVLHHDQLDAIFSLDQSRGAIVLSGAVGKGRLVAIGDSSVLINNMLEFRGNRTFAHNLVRYLAQDGRLWIAAPDTVLAGRYPSVAAADPLAGLRAGLDRLARARLPPAALRVTALVVSLLLLLAAASALPRRATYARATALPAAETLAGFAGRVRFFSGKGRNLLSPLLTYKLELERELLEGLALRDQPSLRDMTEAMRKAGLAEPLIEHTRALLLELEQLALAQERPPSPPHVGERKFHAMVASGDRILHALHEVRARERRS